MYYKIVENNYIVLIGESKQCENPITEKEYNDIKNIFMKKPVAPNGFDYKLTVDYEWKIYELPKQQPETQEEKEALEREWEESV